VEPGYLLALTTGLFGGFGHCLGMCGPIVASYTLSSSSGSRPLSDRLIPHLLYHGGRITMYAFIGALMGLSGSFLNVAGRIAGLQNAVAVAAGITMVLMGLSITGLAGRTAWLERHNVLVLRSAKQVMSARSLLRYYPLGLLLGLLPCGLSYTIFIAAAGTGGLVPGMMTALLFGIGTLPALLLFGAALSYFNASLRSRIYRAGGAVVIVMGIYFIFRGIRLYARL
jgi:sulfite exporter TauE/SafE